MTNQEVKHLIGLKLKGANEAYEVAEDLLEEHTVFAKNRYYYALYYAVTALLLLDGYAGKSHKGAIGEFGRLYVKKGKFSVNDGKLIGQLFQWRTKGDYDETEEYTPEEVEEVRQPTKALISKIEGYINEALA